MAQEQTTFEFKSSLDIYRSSAVNSAIGELSAVADPCSRGAIFTRTEVVDFILDLIGYNNTSQLYAKRILEPSFGGGDFLLSIIRRLVASWKRADRPRQALTSLKDSLRAVELHEDSFEETRASAIALLRKEGISSKAAVALADRWLRQDDFLLTSIDGEFDFVAGNPPYLRQEMIPDALLEVYRRQYSTMYDRADIYVPFIERSLSLLRGNGTLGFICADRWMKNRYGGPLRNMVHDSYHLKVVVDMVDTDAFHEDVAAYPAITIISRSKSAPTRIAHKPPICRKELSKLARKLRSKQLRVTDTQVSEMAGVTDGPQPWLLDSNNDLTLLRRLEDCFPKLEDAGCRVGIGVATGADKAFIDDYLALDVEDDRKLPLAITKDLAGGTLSWTGKGVINPFSDEGGLVDLKEYPRLARYLDERKDLIVRRHVAKKSPKNWYRTIDRISPSLAAEEKLLIPDIKGEAHVVFEGGQLYPHHNLYYITSTEWDLRALQAVLLSPVAKLFVAAYSTKMRGGFLRFQAQYLRRIRLPRWETVAKPLRRKLARAAENNDSRLITSAVFELYQLTHKEADAFRRTDDK